MRNFKIALVYLIASIVLLPSTLLITVARFFYQTSMLLAKLANAYALWVLKMGPKRKKR